ncbi:ATP-binding protein [Paracoccus sp. (in: a-proteobacteria)]|uniref:ATP-binding protein n=1 Tax=Paracoccus sp. TaxID=267 RepID=UPI003A84AFE9
MFNWLRPYVPKSLYGRTALILILPMLLLITVLLIVFVQRHFDGVTRQMTVSVSREVQLIRQSPDDAVADIARILEIDVARVGPGDLPPGDVLTWEDITGSFVIEDFYQTLPDLERVVLPDLRRVSLYLRDGERYLRLSFDRRRVSASNPHQFFVYMLSFGIVLTAIAYVYLLKQVRPIQRLAEAAEAFGRGRHIPYRATGALEVRAAGDAFLDMRNRIERQIEQRTLMLSGVSHDLRTPLTRLKLGLTMLEDADSEDMLRDVNDMERLLDEFLDFSRGAREGDPEDTDPVALVTTIVEDSQRAGLPVTLYHTEGAGVVPLRPGGIRRAVENLITNAVRYGNRAEISVDLTERALRIRIEDDGPGIPESQRAEATKPFARLDPVRNQDLGSGVGLGLSIAMDIARAHGGTLRLMTSERLGGLQADLVIAR